MKPSFSWPRTKSERPLIGLAPMEGVLDAVLRNVLTTVGGFDFCVTEFIRVTDRPVPIHVMKRYCPELDQRGATKSGTPVLVQFLGGQPAPLAESAQLACELGAPGIDLNFGCPAKTVNRHDGGAALLRSPDRIFKIVQAVRRACPPAIDVSAKMRLGYDTPELALELASAIQEAGANALTVHARTKIEMYRPPAHWHLLEPLAQNLQIPMFANGDIWSPSDAEVCRARSGTQHLMLGRGALARPSLAREIQSRSKEAYLAWPEVPSLLNQFVQDSIDFRSEIFAVARLKQWCRYLALHYPEAQELFSTVKKWERINPNFLSMPTVDNLQGLGNINASI